MRKYLFVNCHELSLQESSLAAGAATPFQYQ